MREPSHHILQANNSNKESSSQIKSFIQKIKNNLFRLFYIISKKQNDSWMKLIILTLIEFTQLIAFPLSPEFHPFWKNNNYIRFSNFFQFFHLVNIWKGSYLFYLIALTIIFIYILAIFVILIYLTITLASFQINSKFLLKIMEIIFSANQIIILPILSKFIILFYFIIELLLSIYNCEKLNSSNMSKYTSIVNCKGTIYLVLTILNGFFTLISFPISLMITMFFFEYKSNKSKPSCRYSSQSQLLLLIFKTLLLLLYEFFPIQNSHIVISFITTLISFFLLIHFIKCQSFYNQKANCLYLCNYFVFMWTSLISFLTMLLKQTSFSGGLGLLLIGYPIVIGGCILMYWNMELSLIVKPDNLITNGYEMLKKTEIFLTIVEKCTFEHNRKEQVVLLGYLQQKQDTCELSNNTLKQFLKMSMNVDKDKNKYYNEGKIMLIQYIEFLYKAAINKFPTYIKLRLSYALFLFEKLNKKQKGMFEIETIKNIKKNLEEDYLLFKCSKHLEEKMSLKDDEDNVDCVSALAYKGYVNNFMSLIFKVGMFYTEFWTLLLLYEEDDESQHDNFIKMSELGSKISQAVSEINETFQKMEKINKNEYELTKLYAQFLSEVLNDNKQALLTYDKLSDINDKKAKYDENNIFTLNFKNLSRSEEYQYIILNAQNEYFGTITHISLSVCSLLGFIREELIGQNINILIPEILHETHEKVLHQHKADFKKEALSSIFKTQNQENSSVHSTLKDVCAFARNKAKYLTKLNFKTGIVITEDGDNFFIAKIILDNLTKGTISHNKSCYILTDNDFIIHNFSSNALQMLNLNSSLINNSVDVTDFIKEFNEQCLKYIINTREEDLIQALKQIKIYLINKKYRSPNIIAWCLEDNFNINKYRWRNSSINFMKQHTVSSRLNESPYEFTIGHKKTFVNNEHNNVIANDNGEIHDPNNLDAFPKNNSNSNNINCKSSFAVVNRVRKYSDNLPQSKKTNDESGKPQRKEIKFLLSIHDVVINKKQLGFLFKFEIIQKVKKGKNKDDTNIHKITKLSELKEDSVFDSEISNDKIHHSNDNSEITCKDKIILVKEESIVNPDFIPEQGGYNTFSLDIHKLAFVQKNVHDKNELRDELRQIAFSKLTYAEKQNESEIDEESENEEEGESSSIEYLSNKNSSDLSGSSISSSNEDNNNNNNNNKNNVVVIAPKHKSSVNISPIISINTKTNILLQFYRVDLTHVRFFCYNYETSIIEEIKEYPKLSEVDIKTNKISDSEMKLIKNLDNFNFMNNTTYNAEENQEKKDKSNLNTNTSKTDHKNEKLIILNQIQKALNDKNMETQIIHLYIISIFIFLVTISVCIISLDLFQTSTKEILTFFDLVFQSTIYYQDLLLSVFSVRELTLLKHEGYKNIYEPNRTIYIQEMFNKATSYFQQSTIILENLNAILNNLPTEERTTFQSTEIEIMILTDKRFIKKYSLSMENALMENTMALYHVSLLNFTDVISLNDDVFYFLKNSLNNIMIAAEEQSSIFLEHFLLQTKKIRKNYTIFMIAIAFAYVFCYFIYIIFLEKVDHRKESYLAIFYEIGKGFIITSLSKCEHFLQKVQIGQEIDSKNHTKSFSSSSFSDKLNEDINDDTNIISSNVSSDLRKEFASQLTKEKKKKATSTTNSNKRSKRDIKLIICFFCVFALLGLYVCFVFVFAFMLSKKFDKFTNFVVAYSLYQNKYLFLFISIRELLYDERRTLKGVDIYKSVRDDINNFYSTIFNSQAYMIKYLRYLPPAFQNKYEYLTTCNLCEQSEISIATNLSTINVNCSEFLYGSLINGIQFLFSSFIEDVRMVKNYYDIAKDYGNRENITHNYTLLGSEYYDSLIPKDNLTKWEIFNNSEPMVIYNLTLHKNLIIINSFIFKPFFDKISELTKKSIEKYNDIYSTILNILIYFYLGVLVLLFLFVIIPFQINLSETIYKSKNMLSIIPKEVLATLPHVRKMLGIDIPKQQFK